MRALEEMAIRGACLRGRLHHAAEADGAGRVGVDRSRRIFWPQRPAVGGRVEAESGPDLQVSEGRAVERRCLAEELRHIVQRPEPEAGLVDSGDHRSSSAQERAQELRGHSSLVAGGATK